MITLQLSDLLLAFIALLLLGGLTVGTVASLRLIAFLRRAEKMAAVVGPLLPRLEAMTDEAEATLHEAREVLERARGAADDVEVLTAETRQAAVPLIREAAQQVGAALTPIKHLAALGVGLKTALDAFGNHRDRAR